MPFAAPDKRINAHRWLIAILSGLCLSLSVARAEKIQDLKPRGYVDDFAGVLDAQTTAQITAICTEVDQETHAQISVVTIKTLAGLEASDFANKLFKQWGVGHKEDKRGILILLATDDHKYWTEVGYGLEPILPDGKVGGFGREMVPRLRAGDYNGALLNMTEEVAGVIAADRGVTLSSIPGPVPNTVKPDGRARGPAQIPHIVFFIIFIIYTLVMIAMFGIPLVIIFLVARAVIKGSIGMPRIGMGGQSSGSWSSGGFGASSGGSSGGGGGDSFGGFGGGSSGGGGAGGSW